MAVHTVGGGCGSGVTVHTVGGGCGGGVAVHTVGGGCGSCGGGSVHTVVGTRMDDRDCSWPSSGSACNVEVFKVPLSSSGLTEWLQAASFPTFPGGTRLKVPFCAQEGTVWIY